VVSGDERSTESTVSSPVIKVYGSTGVEAALEAIEATEVSEAD